MDIEIIDTPIRFKLYGKSGAVENERFGETGMKLMDEMWKIVKERGTATTGINHWVYLPGGRMFVGAELSPNTPAPDGLEPLEFELPRYLKHVHVGPYHELPSKWKALKAELENRGEAIGSPSLEVYGHHCEDESKQETTILMGLKGRG